MVVASAVNAEGEQIYPRKWNHDFVGMPILRKEDQHRPTVTETEIPEILASAKRRYAVLFALLAGSGLRIGEALALKATDVSPDCQIVFVRRSIWRGQEQQPKTPNAVREVDLPESLARVLHAHAENKSGYLFATRSGPPDIATKRSPDFACYREKSRAAFFPPIPYGNLAARPMPGGFDKAMARPFQRNRNRFLRLGLAKRLGLAARMGRENRHAVFPSWATWATKRSST